MGIDITITDLSDEIDGWAYVEVAQDFMDWEIERVMRYIYHHSQAAMLIPTFTRQIRENGEKWSYER